MSEPERQCTIFVSNEGYAPDEVGLCHCPKCKGYLPSDFAIGRQFQCKKCGAVLETLPTSDPDLADDEQDEEMEFGGMICVVPDYAVKIELKPYPRPRRVRRHRTDRMARGLGFYRRVWKNVNGEFVIYEGERIPIDDPRILEINKEVST